MPAQARAMIYSNHLKLRDRARAQQLLPNTNVLEAEKKVIEYIKSIKTQVFKSEALNPTSPAGEI